MRFSPHTQLCIPYTGALVGQGSAAARADTFRTWSGGRSRGFACACARCAAYRAAPALLRAEEEAFGLLEGFYNPTEDVAWGWPKPPGPPKPADKVAGPKKRRARLALLGAKGGAPPEARAGLAPLLLLEAWSLSRAGRLGDAAGAAAEAAGVFDALFGPLADVSGTATHVRLDAALFALAAGRKEEARGLARRAAAGATSAWNVWGDPGEFRALAAERARRFGELWGGGAGPAADAAAAGGHSRGRSRRNKKSAAEEEGEEGSSASAGTAPAKKGAAAAAVEPPRVEQDCSWMQSPEAWAERLLDAAGAAAAAC